MIGLRLINSGDGFDLEVQNGAVCVGDTTYQNQAMLLAFEPGSIKQYPVVGVGLNNIINDNELSLWKRKIIQEFEADGQTISKLELTETGLTIEAHYK